MPGEVSAQISSGDIGLLIKESGPERAEPLRATGPERTPQDGGWPFSFFSLFFLLSAPLEQSILLQFSTDTQLTIRSALSLFVTVGRRSPTPSVVPRRTLFCRPVNGESEITVGSIQVVPQITHMIFISFKYSHESHRLS